MITSLGMHIFTAYSGRGINAARRDLRRMNDALVRIDRINDAFSSAGISAFRGAVVATAPALVSLGQGALFAGGALTSMLVSAGSAGGIFGGVMVAAIKRAFELKEAGKQLSQSQRGMVSSVGALRGAWNKFLDRVSPKVLHPASTAVRAISRNIGKLRPLIAAVGPLALKVSRAFARWMDADRGFKRFIGTITRFGVPALNHLQRAARHALGFLGIGFRAFAPEGVKMAAIIERGARALHKWAKQGGFQRFISNVKANGPAIREFFRALGGAIKQVSIALGGMAPVALRLSTALLRIVASLPVPVIQGLIYAYTAWKVATFLMWLWTGRLAMRLIFWRGVMIMCQVTIWAINVAQRAAALASRLWAAAIWLVNIAMRANPIVLVVTLLALLIGAIVWAATKTKFFQTVWKYVWGFIKRVAQVVWGGLRAGWRFTVGIFMGLFRWIGKNAPKIWRAAWGFIRKIGRAIWAGLRAGWRFTVRIIMGLFRFFSKAARAVWRFVWNIVRKVAGAVWRGLRAGWRFTVKIIMGLFRFFSKAARAVWRFVWNTIKKVARGIWNFLKSAWRTTVRIFVNLFRFFSKVARAVWRFAWNTIKKVARGIWNFLKAAWRTTVRIFVGLFRFFRKLATSLWRNTWGRIKSVAKAIGSWLVRNIKGTTNRISGFFRACVNFIRDKWGDLKRITRKPVEFFVNTVYNKGLRGAWNNTVGKIPGVPDLPKAKFARGGKIPGSGGATQDNIPILASAGEYVIRRKVVRQMGTGFFDNLNHGRGGGMAGKRARTGRMSGSPTMPRFFLGGLIDKIGDIAGGALGMVKGMVTGGYDWSQGIFQSVAGKAMKTLMNPFIDMVGGMTKKFAGGGDWTDAIVKWVKAGIQRLIDYILSIAQPDFFGGANVGKALKWARKQKGKPYSLGAFGGAFDCSSFMSGITRIINGQKPSRMFTTHPFHSGRSKVHGFKKGKRSPFEIGITGAGIGHTAGTLGGVNVEATPPRVRVGSGARGSRHGMFRHTYGHIAAAAMPKGSKGNWGQLVSAVLRELGMSVKYNLPLVLRAINKESGGNPRAQNNWDSNARRGTPSGGLLQTIGPTFNSYAGKYRKLGMFHPYANVYAAIRYARARYGRGWARRMAAPGGYELGGLIDQLGVGGSGALSFDNGGLLPKGLSLAYNGTGRPEPVGHDLRGETHVHFHGNVYTRSKREFEDMVVEAVSNAEGKGRIRTRGTKRGA